MQLNETEARRRILTAELRRAISLQEAGAGGGLDKYSVTPDNRPQAEKNRDKYQEEIKRARISLRKHQTELTARALLAGYYNQPTRDNKDEALKKGYLAALFCSSKLIVNQGKTYGMRCGRKYCTTCGNLKTVKNAEKHAAPLRAIWENPYFLTLTVPNCGFMGEGDPIIKNGEQISPRQDLETTVEQMIETARKGWEALRKRNQRKGLSKAGAIRKIEITASPKIWYYKGKRYGNDYHPHFHFLVDSESTGQFLLEYWLKNYPTAEREAQDLKPVTTDAAFLELFKYTQKITAGKKGEKRMYPANMLHEINRVLYKRRTWQPLGTALGLIDEEKINEIESEAAGEDLENGATFIWEPQQSNYFDQDTGEIFANYYTPATTTDRYHSPGAQIWYRANADYLQLALKRWELEQLAYYQNAKGGPDNGASAAAITPDNDKLLLQAYAFLIVSEEKQGKADENNEQLRQLIVKFEALHGPITSWNNVKLAATLERNYDNEKNGFIQGNISNPQSDEQPSAGRRQILRPSLWKPNAHGIVRPPKTGNDLHGRPGEH